MEPADDPKLSETLRTWRAPDAPPTLRGRVLAKLAVTPRDDAAARAHAHFTAGEAASSHAGSGFARALRWLLTGSIRIPVPVGLAAAIAAAWIYFAVLERPSPPDAAPVAAGPEVSLADFTPVERIEPRILGGAR